MCYIEDADKAKEFDCYGIIYDYWLVDIPKLMDLLMIYRFNNDHRLRIWINQIDSRNKEYKDDFKNYIDMVIISYHIILYCIMLYCIVLYCIMLCCVGF